MRRRGRLADTTEVRERAGERDVVDVVAGRLRERTVLAPPGHAPVHQLRVAGEAHVGTEPEPFGHAGPEALDERVGLLDHPQHRLHPVGVLQVDGDGAPPAPVEDEPARPARRRRQLGALDPHHLGAHVGEQRPRERARARCRSARPPSLRAADPRAQPPPIVVARCDVAPAQCHPRAHGANYRVVGSRVHLHTHHTGTSGRSAWSR